MAKLFPFPTEFPFAESDFPSGVEILTMGVERLYRDPFGFAKDAPDHFRFLFQTLQKL